MSSLKSLPTEILALTLRYANLNGDLASLRLVCTTLNVLIWEERDRYLEDVCSNYGISQRVMGLYSEDKTILHSARELRGYLFLRHEVAVFETLSTYLTEKGRHIRKEPTNDDLMTPLLLFSTLSRSLRSTKTTSVTPQEGAITIKTPVSDDTFRWKLSLRELESVISAVDMCSSALWHKSVLEQHVELPESAVSSPDVELQRAVLTEHVIRNGPKRTARILGYKPTHTSWQGTQDSSGANTVNVSSLWPTSKANAAILAAGGVARLLWMGRTVKIEEEFRRRNQGKLEKQKIADLRVAGGVWRESAGDM